MDYSKKESWTLEQLEKTLEFYTVLRPEERGNFDLLWKAKKECEANMGVIIRPVGQEQINNALSYAKATLEIEGRSLTPEGEALVRRRMQGEITHEEFLRAAKKLAENN